uniref:Uncharacterized protein n=1 Tax=Tetradesmus obliquus TaxID=3088 RepID=A0A383V2S2_TETOB|eukprot:jgi/Sobl393_1/2891/SZX59381.1
MAGQQELDVQQVMTAYGRATRNQKWYADYLLAVEMYITAPNQFCDIVGLKGSKRGQFVRTAGAVRTRHVFLQSCNVVSWDAVPAELMRSMSQLMGERAAMNPQGIPAIAPLRDSKSGWEALFHPELVTHLESEIAANTIHLEPWATRLMYAVGLAAMPDDLNTPTLKEKECKDIKHMLVYAEAYDTAAATADAPASYEGTFRKFAELLGPFANGVLPYNGRTEKEIQQEAMCDAGQPAGAEEEEQQQPQRADQSQRGRSARSHS